MTKISKAEVLKLARLSRLRLNSKEVEKLSGELNTILQYVEQLSDVDTEGLKPTYQVTGLKNIMRGDVEVEYGPNAKELLENVPEISGGYIKVKRMIG